MVAFLFRIVISLAFALKVVVSPCLSPCLLVAPCLLVTLCLSLLAKKVVIQSGGRLQRQWVFVLQT